MNTWELGGDVTEGEEKYLGREQGDYHAEGEIGRTLGNERKKITGEEQKQRKKE